MSTTRIYNPIGVRHVEEGGVRQASPIGEVSVIGIVDNTKPNAATLMRSSAEHLHATLPGLEVCLERKKSASEGVSDTAFGKLEHEASVVLVGSAD